MSQPIKIAISGGAGQIAYSLLFRLASGELFGPNQLIELQVLEVPNALSALEGVKMEIEDCAFPLLSSIKICSDPYQAFEDIDYALLIGAKSRGPGMERRDLLQENSKIFVTQGQALNAVAKSSAKIFVVGNPCNTNCLIALNNAPSLKRENFYAMTRLDQNRATFFLSEKSQVSTKDVSCVTIWGNHSATQVPDFVNAKISQQPVETIIPDRQWLEKDFIESVQKRGAAIIQARGKSSAASAASALLDAMRDRILPTPTGKWFSTALLSDGNPYGIEEGLIFSFPCRVEKNGQLSIVSGLKWDAFLEEKIKLTEQELKEEREMVSSILKI
ncbi:malate dehydrogenase [Candidatus Protochlamydia sp. R18]|uniref:malate dehydrogenase n=1 Tax=Candidatus Protochlamydia sp. R18 TaxID=1353977 RepID=UPI0005A76E4D|nr:malate dehydrogenase [Candidatus Protochlamydia sp. R18]